MLELKAHEARSDGHDVNQAIPIVAHDQIKKKYIQQQPRSSHGACKTWWICGGATVHHRSSLRTVTTKPTSCAVCYISKLRSAFPRGKEKKLSKEYWRAPRALANKAEVWEYLNSLHSHRPHRRSVWGVAYTYSRAQEAPQIFVPAPTMKRNCTSRV